MKNKFSILILSILIAALASCNMQGELIDSEVTAENLIGMRSLLPGLEALLALGVESGETVDFAARTIDPTVENADIEAWLQDGSGNPLLPSEVYAANGGNGTNRVRIPSSGYIEDYYTEGMEAYFFLSRGSTDGVYRIELYIYPRTDFSVKYNYEEYLVDENTLTTTWAWQNMDELGNAGQLVAYRTAFADGTEADRTIVWSSADDNGNYFADAGYGAFSVGDDMLGSADYDFPVAIAEPVRLTNDSFITWSSHTSSTILSNNSEVGTVEEFYTESADEFSGVIYSTEENGGTDSRTVTRYAGNGPDGTFTARSRTETGNSYSIWETETNEVIKGTAGDRITYDSTYDSWWSDPAAAQGELSSYRMKMALVETEADSNSYTGTMTEYWGARGGSYNITLDNRNNGTYKIKKSGWTSVSRGVLEEDLEFDVDQNDNLSFSLSVGAGSFSGRYIRGSITGTYSENGSTAGVSIDSAGITVDGIHYKYSELAQ
ncbi:MAG: hypothetical protein JXR86_20465 [Spirochaetales bacterium]|nr:hypothetical protein [Spirochaetales bacterium]